MPFSASLAARTRDALADRPGIAEKRMFGGLAFLLGSKLLVGVFGDSLLVRLGPDGARAALALPHVGEFAGARRPMKGWVLVGPDGLENDAEIARWAELAIEFVEALP